MKFKVVRDLATKKYFLLNDPTSKSELVMNMFDKMNLIWINGTIVKIIVKVAKITNNWYWADLK